MPQVLEHADGRWAWMVLLASFVTQALTVAFPPCIGIFFTDLQRDFQASNSETSWFPSILGAMVNSGGPLCSVLVEHFGYRVTMMLGGLLASLGMVAGSFSRTLNELFLMAGAVTGLLLDTTNNFTYVFYMSSAFLISAGLFMGGGFYVAEKKQDRQARAEDNISENTPMQGPSLESKDSAKKQLCSENMYVTSV